MEMRQRLSWLFLWASLASGLRSTSIGNEALQRFARQSGRIRSSKDAEPALQRTARHLEKLKQSERRPVASKTNELDQFSEEKEDLYKDYIQRSANALKEELKSRGLPRTGRKPDLAARLVEYDWQVCHGIQSSQREPLEDVKKDMLLTYDSTETKPVLDFAGISLSETAGMALGAAGFVTPSPIQAAALPLLVQGESLILHAETGSGKTLAYLLPFTETLWSEKDDEAGFAVVLTPTRELAAQVAGVASALSPPGSVRLVAHATNLMSDGLKDRGELQYGGRLDDISSRPRLFVGSAKAVMHSLYGDGVMPASPTSKPEAIFFLRNLKYIVLDEVDRLLHVQKSRSGSQKRPHEKPAAVIAAAVARLTLGRAQFVAASATVGRPLRREVARVLGLAPQDCPPVIRTNEVDLSPKRREENDQRHVSRAVTIPTTVSNYVIPVDGTSVGKLLTSAFQAVQILSSRGSSRRMLLVLTKGCGMSTKNAIGALKHFRCKPEPQSLLDVLEAPGSDRLIQVHQEVAGAIGVGMSVESGDSAHDDGYLFVTGEDTVRGLHLDGLDTVIVVGRAQGPDEYTHIAGRTGRQGRHGSVINVVSDSNASALKSWERMLDITFERLDLTE